MFTLKQSAIVFLLISQSCSLVWIYSIESRLPDKKYTLFYSYNFQEKEVLNNIINNNTMYETQGPQFQSEPAELLPDQQSFDEALRTGDEISFDNSPDPALFGDKEEG
jgi:hypothetical protein